MNAVEVTAPTNIAIVKYWGKRCCNLNLPLNSSLSVTLNQEHLKTTTKVMTSSTFTEDEVILNSVKQNINGNQRFQKCLSEIRSIARLQSIKRGENSCEEMKFSSQKVKVFSENNFPTAAGLASSASGYAALVLAMAKLFGVEGDLTSIARLGSGSACRSMHGGFVQWDKGKEADGSDSIGIQLVPSTYWEDLRIFVIVVNDVRKKVGSTEGMQLTVDTSTLLKYRISHVVDDRLRSACDAVKSRDFPKLADVIMRESNQLHAVCLDTNPPLHYMNDASFMIIDMVHSYNRAIGSLQAAYTFDAGPNACLFTTASRADELAWLIDHYFPSSKNREDYFKGMQTISSAPPDYVIKAMGMVPHRPDLLQYVICTTVGGGPEIVESVEAGHPAHYQA